jgi:hypothetical protein
MIHAHRGDISGLVGAIYDCAYNRERWPDTLRQICQALDCVAGVLSDLAPSGRSADWDGRQIPKLPLAEAVAE